MIPSVSGTGCEMLCDLRHSFVPFPGASFADIDLGRFGGQPLDAPAYLPAGSVKRISISRRGYPSVVARE